MDKTSSSAAIQGSQGATRGWILRWIRGGSNMFCFCRRSSLQTKMQTFTRTHHAPWYKLVCVGVVCSLHPTLFLSGLCSKARHEAQGIFAHKDRRCESYFKKDQDVAVQYQGKSQLQICSADLSHAVLIQLGLVIGKAAWSNVLKEAEVAEAPSCWAIYVHADFWVTASELLCGPRLLIYMKQHPLSSDLQ